MKITKFTEEQIIAAIRSQVSGKDGGKGQSGIGHFSGHVFQMETEIWWHDYF